MKNRYQKKLDSLQREGLLRQLFPVAKMECQFIYLNGKKLVNFSSNDYLGYGSDLQFRNKFYRDLQNREELPAPGALSSRLMVGNHREYLLLESFLEQLYGKPSLVFGSGYHANIGIIQALGDKKTVFFADKLVHASIIDGLKISGSTFFRYRHNDTEHLRDLLKKHRSAFEYAVIISESLFSMDGDIAPLTQLIELKHEFDAAIYLDEAHAIGVRGNRGLGLSEECGLLQEIDFLVGTFGKAVASSGAFVISSKEIKDYLINVMRSLIFTTGLSPLQIAWTRFVLQAMVSDTEKREKLAYNSRYFIKKLSEAGVNAHSQSQIIPIFIGENNKTIKLVEYLRSNGQLVWPIRPPTVPKNTARIRLSVNAGHDRMVMDRFVEILKEGLDAI
ncbi:MAG: 8-amino-7-oxononanoate synthase [Calditrichia bacterium]